MTRFRVWLRPLGNTSRVRVEGKDNTGWLLGRLSQSFVFKNSEPVCEEMGSACCTFHVSYGAQVSRLSFEKLLAAIPEVLLMSEPA